jgi:hypothetical protein
MADDADEPTSDRFLEVYLLWLFGWVLFCESAGDSVSRYMIPWAQRIATAPLEQMPQISWGSAVLATVYRGLCSVVTRPASREAILLGCPLLLQMWIHERFDIDRSRADLLEYEPLPDGPDPQRTSPPWVLCGASALTVYFGTPNMFITLWFGFDYGTNPPLSTLII